MSQEGGQPNNKQYGAYKVSEYTHKGDGKGYKVDESSGVPARENALEKMASQFEMDSENDFKKKHQLGKNQQEFKKEYKTMGDALKGFNPLRIRQRLHEVKNLTPEEYETILMSYEEVKVNIKLYSFFFTSLGLGFTYWQRANLTKSFYLVPVLLGLFSGVTYGAIKTGTHFVEAMDQLGKDYESARIIKQDIFDTRPDIDSGMRAQYYMYQQRKNEEFEKKHGLPSKDQESLSTMLEQGRLQARGQMPSANMQ